jgi:hypothetical protein
MDQQNAADPLWGDDWFNTEMFTDDFLPTEHLSCHSTSSYTPPEYVTRHNSATSSDACPTPLEDVRAKSRKRRRSSEESLSDSLVRTRKTRKLRAPEETAKTRERGACFLCQSKRKEVGFQVHRQFATISYHG